MAPRVKILFVSNAGEHLEAVGVLNGGFESEEPAVLLPARAAKILFSRFPEGTELVTGEEASSEEEYIAIPERVSARVLTPDREGTAVECILYASTGAREILLSDSAIDDLGVKIESFRKGHWRFADEDGIRESEPPQRW